MAGSSLAELVALAPAAIRMLLRSRDTSDADSESILSQLAGADDAREEKQDIESQMQNDESVGYVNAENAEDVVSIPTIQLPAS